MTALAATGRKQTAAGQGLDRLFGSGVDVAVDQGGSLTATWEGRAVRRYRAPSSQAKSAPLRGPRLSSRALNFRPQLCVSNLEGPT